MFSAEQEAITMPTVNEHLRALEKAKAAGDTEAAEYIKSQLVLQQRADDAQAYNPVSGMSGMGKFRAGIGQGMVNVTRHAGNLVGLVSDNDIANAKSLDSALLNTTAGRIGAMIGETAATAPLMMAGSGIIARGGSAAAKLIANPITRGVIEGAGQGALMGDPGERGRGAIVGGVLGGILPAVAQGGSKLVRGLKRTPEAQALLNQGVDLTPGQMNPGGVINQLEESWTSVPGVGSVVKGARENAQNSFQRVATEAAAAPGTKIARGESSKMLEQAYQSFEPLYDQAKGFPVKPLIMNAAGQDVPLVNALKSAVNSKSVPATAAARKRAELIIKNELSSGFGTSDDILRIRSSLRTASRDAMKSSETLQRDVAEILTLAEGKLTAALDSQLPPDAMNALRSADSQYGLFKTIEDAVARAKDKPGGFTAADLSRAVADTMKGQGKGAYARGGGGVLRDLASAGTETMNVRSPATGARLAAILGPLGLGAAAPTVGIPLGSAMLGLIGTQAGRKMASGSTAPQQAIQRLLDQYGNETAQGVLGQYGQRALVTGGLFDEK